MKRKKLSILMMALAGCMLTGCEKKSEIVSDYEVEKESELEEEVAAADAVYPEAELDCSYLISQPGTFSAKDYVKNIEDETETSVGFLAFEKREDLRQMTDQEVEEDAKSGSENQAFTDEMTWEQEKEITEEGIYDVQIAVRNAADNMKVFNCTFYIDGTGPNLPEHEDETIQINDVDGAFEPDLSDYYCTDNFDDDWKVVDETTVRYESQDYYINDDGKSVEDVKIIIESKDRAGNESERSWIITAINDYDYVGEFNKIFEEAMKEDAGAAVSEISDSASDSSTPADAFDRAKAEEEFALVNQKRAENGSEPLTWDESMYELACVRAQECVQSFSHTRPDGTIVTETHQYGENLAKNFKSTTNLINGWMNSPGHRDNLLNPEYTRGVMACYYSGGIYYWVNLFAW